MIVFSASTRYFCLSGNHTTCSFWTGTNNMTNVSEYWHHSGQPLASLAFAKQARNSGIKRLVAAAFEDETDPTLASLVDEIVWLKVGQLAKLIAVFTDRQIKQCVMVGQIAPKNLFDIRPDLRAMALLWRLQQKNAHTIFGAIAEELKKDGVELIEATPWLKR